jgi:hypothetical protein
MSKRRLVESRGPVFYRVLVSVALVVQPAQDPMHDRVGLRIFRAGDAEF